jgi:hypothetical protein
VAPHFNVDGIDALADTVEYTPNAFSEEGSDRSLGSTLATGATDFPAVSGLGRSSTQGVIVMNQFVLRRHVTRLARRSVGLLSLCTSLSVSAQLPDLGDNANFFSGYA